MVVAALVPEEMHVLVLTAAGDLFMIDKAGAVYFLDTIAGARGRA